MVAQDEDDDDFDDSDGLKTGRQTCVGCGAVSPPTSTNYTLISSSHGWRLTRERGANGSLLMEWRCPSCWTVHKRLRDAAAAGAGRKKP